MVSLIKQTERDINVNACQWKASPLVKTPAGTDEVQALRLPQEPQKPCCSAQNRSDHPSLRYRSRQHLYLHIPIKEHITA